MVKKQSKNFMQNYQGCYTQYEWPKPKIFKELSLSKFINKPQRNERILYKLTNSGLKWNTLKKIEILFKFT